VVHHLTLVDQFCLLFGIPASFTIWTSKYRCQPFSYWAYLNWHEPSSNSNPCKRHLMVTTWSHHPQQSCHHASPLWTTLWWHHLIHWGLIFLLISGGVKKVSICITQKCAEKSRDHCWRPRKFNIFHGYFQNNTTKLLIGTKQWFTMWLLVYQSLINRVMLL
jgi:hypothetical protein